jgi:gamma-glutamylputrescine oxidase
MLSYWEQQSFTAYDHVIVGSGIVGVSTAIELKQKFPDDRVLILERGLLPTGATTRNAGFACTGSVTELLEDLKTISDAELVEIFTLRRNGLNKLRNRFTDEQIGYASNGGYELLREEELYALDKIPYLNKLLEPITEGLAFGAVTGKIGDFGFDDRQVKGMIENVGEGELNSGRLMRSLLELARKLGIEMSTGAEAISFEEHGSKVAVLVKDGFRNAEWTVETGRLFICTNAFTKKLLPGADVIPGRGQVVVTSPIKDLKFKGTFHLDKGYYYFREIDGRVLLGGGRNMDFEGETTTKFETTELIQNDLERKLRELIIPNTEFTIEHRWAGIMAFGVEKGPIIKAFSDRVFGAFRMSGMGVAIGTEVAERIVGLV